MKERKQERKKARKKKRPISLSKYSIYTSNQYNKNSYEKNHLFWQSILKLSFFED